MLYKYDKEKLVFVRINSIAVLIIASLLLIIAGLATGYTVRKKVVKETEAEVMVIMAKQNEFNQEKFTKKIKELNFTFPYIVYAQAVLETDNFKSKLFIENHNLFAMKEAVKRINTAKGTQYQHAYYDSWIESVYDYAMYSATYLSNLKTESDYFDYLGQSYAEDKSYVSKLKSIIERDGLKQKFGY